MAASITLAVLALASACSLDWTVRDDPGGGPAADGGSDATDAPAGPTDASDSAAPDDAAGTDGSACSGLASDVATAKLAARACQLAQAGQCTTTVTDECGCMVVVRTANSTESKTYADAVMAYLASCGKPTCAACPQLGPPASWACLQNPSAVECAP